MARNSVRKTTSLTACLRFPAADLSRFPERDERTAMYSRTLKRRVATFGAERGEHRILSGSDPTLSGLAAAQCLRRRGSLPPNLSSRVPRSVAGRVVSRRPDKIESHE